VYAVIWQRSRLLTSAEDTTWKQCVGVWLIDWSRDLQVRWAHSFWHRWIPELYNHVNQWIQQVPNTVLTPRSPSPCTSPISDHVIVGLHGYRKQNNYDVEKTAWLIWLFSVTFLDFVMRGWSYNVCISAHYKCQWWWWWWWWINNIEPRMPYGWFTAAKDNVAESGQWVTARLRVRHWTDIQDRLCLIWPILTKSRYRRTPFEYESDWTDIDCYRHNSLTCPSLKIMS